MIYYKRKTRIGPYLRTTRIYARARTGTLKKITQGLGSIRVEIECCFKQVHRPILDYSWLSWGDAGRESLQIEGTEFGHSEHGGVFETFSVHPAAWRLGDSNRYRLRALFVKPFLHPLCPAIFTNNLG